MLASAYAGWAGSLPPEEVSQRMERAQRDLDRPPAEWVGDYLPTFFARSVSQDVLDETMAMMLDTRPAGMRAALRAFAEADLRDMLPTIAVPTLLLYGAADQRSPRHVAKDLHTHIPGSQLVVLPATGHDSKPRGTHRLQHGGAPIPPREGDRSLSRDGTAVLFP